MNFVPGCLVIFFSLLGHGSGVEVSAKTGLIYHLLEFKGVLGS
jgi:hypothetical protein